MTHVDDNTKQVNERLNKRAEDGWELVSGSAVTYQERGFSRIRYVTYWRRACLESDSTMT
jgi:hypothetical protein